MSTMIIDVGAGNLHSVHKACAYVTGSDIIVSAKPDDVANADRILLPGVGAFNDCMAGLASISGMREALEYAVRTRGVPFLGICVGMQMLFDEGHEHGITEGLGWLKGRVVALEQARLPIPHMGWNMLIKESSTHPLLRDIGNKDFSYFVHSYHACDIACEDLLASVDYGGRIVAMVARDNISGMQFHPEKSQDVGLQLLRNFMEWQP